MNEIDLAFRRLQEANPEPDARALLRSVTSPERDIGGRPMQSDQITIESQHREPEGPTRSRWMAAAVAAIVVVVASIAIPTVTNTPYADMTELEIAEALASGDIERPSEVVAADATFDIGGYAGGYEDIDRYAEFTRRIGVENSEVSCVGTGTITCTWRMTNTVTRALGLTPAFANNELTFGDGLIQAWSAESNLMWGGFFEWLPDDAAATMFTVVDGGIELHLDDAALAAWEENVNAYAEFVAEEG